ncbi:DUF4290 domain-containing protein [Labilibaculum sp. DW002]|uniref:DUF4290 domain-containing protein n=1 Tax=Paralabilibaculum antarcticum TaxID=2912572 RepID=A0ABT5VSA5_9BACT|nr:MULTISPECIES: DUF4290 domain-containing protein [unclassified Labilibaculum]MBI9056388.1 DUF4290 domain-containing protein [Labilibaculum sp.]MDE5418172.1 DUF4290 domain-containing protein [Labilibaculum sp. DW002]
MDYNSARKHLVLPEYGRNVQKMVDFALTVEDRDERNRVVKSIIAIMGNMYPHLRDVSDFRHKLWDHLAIMSDFALDIDSPYEAPTREKLAEKPDQLPYNNQRIRYRHYGRTIEALILKAIELEDQKEKDALILMIANHMKKSFLNWNKDSVPDEKIFKDLVEMSKGKLEIPENMRLREIREKDFIQKKKPVRKNTRSDNRNDNRNDHRKHNKPRQ